MAEPTVLSADLLAIVSPPRPTVEVAIAYRLRSGGSSVMPLAALELGASRAIELSATHQGRSLEIRPSSNASPRRRELEVVLSETLAAQHEIELEVHYLVEEGLLGEDDGPLAASLPIVAVLWPPASETAEVFRAEVRLPDGWSLFDPFPSGLSRLPSPLDDTGIGVRLPVETWRARLPVVPSMLRFRLRHGAAPPLSVDRVADLFTLALLSALSVFGWSRLRREARR